MCISCILLLLEDVNLNSNSNLGGAQLRQLDMPPDLVGRTYGELFARLTLTRKLLPLGLYR